MSNPAFNKDGELMVPVYMTSEAVEELIRLIDDEPVDEDLLKRIRMKLVAKGRKRLAQYANGTKKVPQGTPTHG